MKRTDYIDLVNKKVIIAQISDSLQEKDLTIPPNCSGYGRIRHFKRNIKDWINDPLPIDPAIKALGKNISDIILAQVFQLAYCNMNCWYCFVPDELKSGMNCTWFSAEELFEKFLEEKINDCYVIDISGGNPELTPEFILWFMQAIMKKKKENDFYLWSDDTISTNSMEANLSKQDIEFMSHYKNYGKVCCFKGFDNYSYHFNTGNSGIGYENQFIYLKKYIDYGFDVYAYITLTTDNIDNIEKSIKDFFDRVQKNIVEYFPLRIIPLKIREFTPTQKRINKNHIQALLNQKIILNIWNEEIEKRFSMNLRNINIADIKG